MKTILLKRHVKLKNLRYEIDGVDSYRPLIAVLSAVTIGFIIALLVFVFGLAFISWV